MTTAAGSVSIVVFLRRDFLCACALGGKIVPVGRDRGDSEKKRENKLSDSLLPTIRQPFDNHSTTIEPIAIAVDVWVGRRGRGVVKMLGCQDASL